MNCSLCIEKSGSMCYHCKQMQTASDWLYELDEGQRMCKCPDCGRRMYIGPYQYANPYKFCPYCGRKNVHGEQMTLDCTWR
jgi:DNA-directed RNA polymerase subunit RPC12/RpoP